MFFITFLAAGFYPALILSELKPMDTLNKKIKVTGKSYPAKVLVVIQFSLATLLIIITMFTYAQYKFLTQSDLGYNDKNIIEFVADKAIMSKSVMDVCKTMFSNITGVEKVAYRNVGKFGGKTRAGGKEFAAVYEHIDNNYLPTLDTSILAGRNFSNEFPFDYGDAVMVNETFAKEARWKNPIGKTVDFMNIPGWGEKENFDSRPGKGLSF